MFGPSSSSERERWLALPSAFATAAPGLIDSRSLTRRIDTKFVMPLGVVLDLVAGLAQGYAVIGSAVAYDTQYFDTPDLVLYHDHRRGRRLRHKVRIRHYRDRRVSYFEIKSRRSAAMTDKLRSPHAFGDDLLNDEEQQLVQRVTGLSTRVVPQVVTSYERLTLIALGSEERVTVDTNLRFCGPRGELVLGGVAIVEVKQPRRDFRTQAMAGLRDHGLHPTSVSKYCAAIVGQHTSLRASPRQRALLGAAS